MRKGMAQGLARPAPWDRNPVVRGLSYSVNGIAPHGQTTRWSYTVPAGKKAIVDEVQAVTLRETAPAPAGLAYSYLQYQANGQGITNLCITIVESVTVGVVMTNPFGQIGILVAGDQILGVTNDGSTGGTVFYHIAAKYTEFDA